MPSLYIRILIYYIVNECCYNSPALINCSCVTNNVLMLAFKADQLFLRDKQRINVSLQLFLRDKQRINVSLQGKSPHKRTIIYLKFNKICILCFDGSHSYLTNNVKCISKHKHSFTIYILLAESTSVIVFLLIAFQFECFYNNPIMI